MQSQTIKVNTNFKSGYSKVNGLKMYYEIHGTEHGHIPLVLIHGGGSTIQTSFGRVIPKLSKNRKIIAVELQCHGHTACVNDRPYTFKQDVDDVVALLKDLKVEKADFLGFSNGAVTTMQIAISYSNIANRIVLVSANYKRDGMIPGSYEGLQNATLEDLPELLKKGYLKVAPNKKHLQLMFNKDREKRLSFEDYSDNQLRSIETPALIMASDQDIVTIEHTVEMSQLIPNARLAILPGTHGSFIGAAEAVGPYSIKEGSKLPETTVALVEEFLNK